MTPAVVAAAVALVAVAVFALAEWDQRPRPRHAGAGVGALNVWQLVGQDVEHRPAGRHRLGEPTETAQRLPEREPGEHLAPPLADAPARERTVPPDDLMQRILDRLRAL